MTDARPPAVVFGGGINGLGLVRNLGREGVPVYLVIDGPDQAAYSKYCKKSFLLEDFTKKPSAVKSFLVNFVRLNHSTCPVVFSTNDRTTLILSALRDQMASDCNFAVPNVRCAKTLITKNKFYASLSNSNIEHPRVIDPKTLHDLRQAGDELGYPIFVRPCISQTFTEVMGKKGFLASSERELTKYCEMAAKARLPVILQELIPGPASNIFGIAGYFDSHYRPTVLFGYRRLRSWPLIIGNNSLAESIPLSDLRSAVNPLVSYLVNLHYRGIMEAEFKLDPRDGLYKLLEVNARSWWQNSFPTKCGLNLVYKAYLDCIGLPGSYTEEYSVGTKWINLVEDIAASFADREIMKSSWVTSLVGVKDYAFFEPADPAPALINILFDLGLINRSLGRLRPAILRSTLRESTGNSRFVTLQGLESASLPSINKIPL